MIYLLMLIFSIIQIPDKNTSEFERDVVMFVREVSNSNESLTLPYDPVAKEALWSSIKNDSRNWEIVLADLLDDEKYNQSINDIAYYVLSRAS